MKARNQNQKSCKAWMCVIPIDLNNCIPKKYSEQLKASKRNKQKQLKVC